MLSAVESEREETHQLFLENNESIQVICTKHSNKTEFFSVYGHISREPNSLNIYQNIPTTISKGMITAFETLRIQAEADRHEMLQGM